ncbi:MAG: hypothetical protein JWO11_30 [Nocardioides sp.]|nr:hypothetical protein [Nocardioides sp.]
MPDRRASLLPPDARHLVSRFTFGLTPELATRVRRDGGAPAWFEAQLNPGSIADPGIGEFDTWWSTLGQSPRTLWANNRSGVVGGWQVMVDYQRWVLMRRMHSQRQVLEVMTEFWENHLNVPTNGEPAFTHRRAYGDMIRAGALGTYEDLLFAAITHPAMLIYLDNAQSTAAHPNENLGRELLELHTVGRGNYDEDQVKDSARILTGWQVDVQNTWEPSYEPSVHAVGAVSVLGFFDDNRLPDGRNLTRRYLSYLARHPKTAERIAFKLATKFVRDDPPGELVDRLARTYLENGTAIVPVLRALVASPEFKRAAGLKVRDPSEDVVATYRALGVKLSRPRNDDSAANTIIWQSERIGLTPFAWPRPDGAPLDNAAWSTPSRMLASFTLHHQMGGGWWPKTEITYRPHEAWVPSFPIHLDQLVDHLSRLLLHRPASTRLLKACCQAVDMEAGTTIDRHHGLLSWGIPLLLGAILDSPDHFHR